MAVAGAPDVLRALAQRYRVGIVSSRSADDAAAFLAQFGLADPVGAVITRENTKRLKPHPAPIRLAAEKLGVPVEQCVMVGDTNVDVRAAKIAGALAVAVLCGFGERGDFGEADLILGSTSELAAWL